jgi:metal-responsive CopG/Arc/MetJ family transcriptional regulator
MTNLQVSIDERLLAEINNAGNSRGLDMTQIIREALHGWLKRRKGLHFDQERNATLNKSPDTAGRAEDRHEARAWFER